VRANPIFASVLALCFSVATVACATQPKSGNHPLASSGTSPPTVTPATVAAWEAATAPVTRLPPLKSLSSGQIEHAWVQVSNAQSKQPPTLLTAQQIRGVPPGYVRLK